MQFMEERWRRW